MNDKQIVILFLTIYLSSMIFNLIVLTIKHWDSIKVVKDIIIPNIMVDGRECDVLLIYFPFINTFSSVYLIIEILIRITKLKSLTNYILNLKIHNTEKKDTIKL